MIIKKVIPIKVTLFLQTDLISKYLKEYVKFHFKKTLKSKKNIEDNLEAILLFYEKVGQFTEKKEQNKDRLPDLDKQKKLRKHYMDILIKGIDFDPRFSNKILGLQLTQLFKFLRRLRNSGCLSPKLDALTHNFMDFKEKWTKFGADMVP